MRINNNVGALNAWRNVYINDTALSKSMEKLSSGYRINRAADDAAGLAISEKMRAQISGLNMAIKNAQDGISLIQTAEGALNETHAILRRMRDLAVQAANDTYTNPDRLKIQDEIDALIEELDRIATTTQFNTLHLLDNTNTLTFHIGANADENLTVDLQDMQAATLGVDSISVSDQTSANGAITTINNALETVSSFRSKLGAVQNRLEHTISNLQVAAENLTASESRIRDVDMALETTNFVKNQILVQAATAMLAQANARPQSVLQLLG